MLVMSIDLNVPITLQEDIGFEIQLCLQSIRKTSMLVSWLPLLYKRSRLQPAMSTAGLLL